MDEHERAIKQILKDRPFQNILDIKDHSQIESLASSHARSGNTYKVLSHSRHYKLNYVPKLLDAKDIERNVKKIPHIFPRFHGRNGRYLLFDWLAGANLSELAVIPDDVFYQLGKICGEVHALEDVKKDKHADDFFDGLMRTITKHEDKLPKGLQERIRRHYAKQEESLKKAIVLDVNDIHKANFVYHDNKVYLVDEGGLGHKIKGIGIAKGFHQFIREPRHRELFWKGYSEHHSNGYFTPEYHKFLDFVGASRTLAACLDYGKDEKGLEGRLARIKELL